MKKILSWGYGNEKTMQCTRNIYKIQTMFKAFTQLNYIEVHWGGGGGVQLTIFSVNNDSVMT